MNLSKLPQDDTGRVRVYCPESEQYRYMFPVDVREAIASGEKLTTGPETKTEEQNDDALEERVAKANTKQLEVLVKELGLDLDLSKHEKLDEKRKAVLEAAPKN